MGLHSNAILRYCFCCQGYHCSRCMYTAHCSGCEVSRDHEVVLQPGDHLAVRFSDLSEEVMEGANKYVDHKSMEDCRQDSPLTLVDCFNAFMDRCESDFSQYFAPCDH